MSDQREQDITTVCEVAFEWAGEYGFSDPEEATRIWEAAARLRPDLEPKPPIQAQPIPPYTRR